MYGPSTPTWRANFVIAARSMRSGDGVHSNLPSVPMDGTLPDRDGYRVAAMSPDDLLAIAREAAEAAAPLLLERFGTERALASKSTPTDLVSEADLAAERAIRAVLAARVPDDAIMAEEGDDVAGTSGRRWIVDPLDGTVNYLYGIPQWCISVACEGLAGVVLDPVRGEVFTATADGPARLD